MEDRMAGKEREREREIIDSFPRYEIDSDTVNGTR